MINAAWSLRPIGELFKIGAGKTMSAAARNADEKTPFLRTSNVLWDEIDLTTVDTMAISTRELETKLLRPGDLLVCEGGDIGRAAVWNGEIDVMSFQNHLHRLRPHSDAVDPRFYVYFLQAAFTQLGIFEGVGNRTTIPNLSRNRLASLLVPLPDIKEQHRIVSALSRVRGAIQLHNQSIALAGDLKRVAMRTIFTLGLKGHEQKQTEIGLVPNGWANTTLGALCSLGEGRIQTGPFGSQLHAREYQSSGVPVVNPTHLAGNRINHENVPRISENRAASMNRHRLQEGDLLFARRGEIGRLGLVGPEEIGWVCGTGCFVVRVRDPHVYNPFLAYLFTSAPIVEWLVANAAGAIMPNLNNVVLGKLPVLLPDVEEQRQIAAMLDAIDRKVDLHRRRLDVLNQLFRALLYRIMTGEISVTDLDLSVLEVKGTERAAIS